MFIALVNLFMEIKKGLSTNKVFEINIFNLVRKLKEMRRFLLENIEQYIFTYTFVYELLNKEFNTK